MRTRSIGAINSQKPQPFALSCLHLKRAFRSDITLERLSKLRIDGFPPNSDYSPSVNCAVILLWHTSRLFEGCGAGTLSQ